MGQYLFRSTTHTQYFAAGFNVVADRCILFPHILWTTILITHSQSQCVESRLKCITFPGNEGCRAQKQKIIPLTRAIASALCIYVCTRKCAYLAVFTMKTGNVLFCPAERLASETDWLISYPYPSLIRKGFCWAVSSLLIGGCLTLHNTLVKREK